MNLTRLALAIALALPGAAGAQAKPPAAPGTAWTQEKPPAATDDKQATPTDAATTTQPAPGADAAPPPAPKPIWRFVPRISLTETWTDNLRLQPDAVAQSGWITDVVPGLSLEHYGPRLNVNADYRYQRSYHSDARDLDDSQNYLTSSAAYEVVEKRIFLEARANISQENRSAFSAPVIPGSPTSNANRAETTLLDISPVARGQFGDVAVWQARFTESDLRTKASFGFPATQVNTSELLASIRSAPAAARLGWAIDANGLQSRTDTTGTLNDKRVRGDLIFGIGPQLHVLLIEGYEKTDFTLEGTQSGSTPGGGLEWSPNTRTQFVGVAQRRFFGTGHEATFTYRTPFTAWRFASTKDATVLTSVLGSNSGTLEQLMSNLLLYSIPDPIARGEEARRRLRALGEAPTAVNTGFLTERPFVFDSQSLSFTLNGKRNTVTLTYERRLQTALGAAPLTGDSFALSDEIRQRNYNAAWTHRLTPLTTFTASFSGTRSQGVDSSGLSSKEDLATIYFNTQLGPRLTGSLGLRRVDFESNQAPNYRENAVFGTLSFHL